VSDLNAKKQAPKGVLSAKYVDQRVNRRAFSYRLKRRAHEVISMMEEFHPNARDLLDLGPAEGKSLTIVQNAFPDLKCSGLEYSEELIALCKDERLSIVQGDAMKPPFPDESFDVVTATALIEHVDNPAKMLNEVHRILRPGGLVIITTPDPFFEKIAVAIGHLKDEDHQETMTCKTLSKYLISSGFTPGRVEKFMCWPWGLPGELTLERAMKNIGLEFMLLNQIAVGIKARAS